MRTFMSSDHEHHHGLVFAVRLKKASKTDDETLKKYISSFLEQCFR